MIPTIWGPTAWMYLHLLSLSYPDNPEKKDIANHQLFLEYFGKTLPCEKCRNNYSRHLETFSLKKALESKSSYINFIWKLHNKVNEDLGKKLLSFSEFINMYKNIIDNGNNNLIIEQKYKNLYRKIIFLLIIVIISLLFILYRKF